MTNSNGCNSALKLADVKCLFLKNCCSMANINSTYSPIAVLNPSYMALRYMLGVFEMENDTVESLYSLFMRVMIL